MRQRQTGSLAHLFNVESSNQLTPWSGAEMEPICTERTLLGMDHMASSASDSELWARVLDQDGEAFGLIFDRYRDRVFAHSFRLVRSSPEAEDVTAMVFLEAWRCRKKIQTADGRLLGWLLVTANNMARNHLRSKLRYGKMLNRLPDAGTVPDHSDEVAEEVDSATRSGNVQAAFQSLSRRDQEVLSLCILEGLPVTEVSRLLRVPSGTVKSRLSRAKNRLATLLGEGNAPHQRTPAPEGGIQ